MRTWLLGLDLLAVLFFVVAGRANHAEAGSLSGILITAAPFTAGLVVGWVISRAWIEPTRPVTGLIVTAATVGVGMVLRRVVFAEGTAASFVVVTSLLLTALMVGWRLVADRNRAPA